MKSVLAAFLVVVSLFQSCTYENKIENDIETKALEKSQFNGEWFTRATLVAKHSHSAFGFTGMECPTERIRFEITKDKLLAFQSHDKGEKENQGRSQKLVAAFSITKHFDLKKTDAKEPQISETRPWHERDFIEVDWSSNLAPHIDCNQWLQSITTTTIDNNDAADPKDPFRVRIEDDYMETTINALVEPDQKTCVALDEWSCHPADYRVKFSFKKVDANNDYEPQNYPDAEPIRYGKKGDEICLESEQGCVEVRDLWLYSDARRFEICDPLVHNIHDCFMPQVNQNHRFGFFRTTVQGYDRKEGFSRRGNIQLINRHNLWEKSKDGDDVIELAKRIPKKIVYYLNPGFPADLLPSVKRVEQEWNTAFMNVVAKVKSKCTIKYANDAVKKYSLDAKLRAKHIDRIDESTLKDACKEIFASTKDREERDVFFTGDPAEVLQIYGPMFEIRVNDCNKENVLRYVKKHKLDDVLAMNGIADIVDDNVENACAVLEWIGDERNLADVFHFQQIGDLRYSFVNAVTKPDANLLGYGPSGVDPKTGEIISGNANIYLSAITDYATKSAKVLGFLEKENLNTDSFHNGYEKHDEKSLGLNAFTAFVSKTIHQMTKDSYKMKRAKSYQARNFGHALKLSGFESFRGWPEFNFDAVFLDDNGEESDVGLLLTMISAAEKSDFRKLEKRNQFFSERSACFSHDHELPYARLTTTLKNRSLLEKIAHIKATVFEAVLKHELGHTFGLRHNFKGTYDALNYPPNFWGVNTDDFLMREGLSKEELRSSSIMDYHKRFNSDFSGLGLYDYAALLSGYAGKVEVFDTTVEDFIPHSFIGKLYGMHYQDFPYVFSGGNADQILSRHYDQVKDRSLRGDGSAHLAINTLGLTARPENFYKRRLVDYQTLKKQKLDAALNNKARDFVEVPYAYCTDGQINGADIACKPFTFGSSPSEIVETAVKDFELMRTITDLGGDFLPTQLPSYLNYVYSRVYAPILRTYQWMYASSLSEEKILPGIYDLAVGAKTGLDFISRVLQRIEPGEYCKDDTGNYVLQSSDHQCQDPLIVDDILGKKYRSDFGDELIGHKKSIGYVYDKILALLALIDDDANIGSQFSSWDDSQYSIGFYRVFTPQITKLFADFYTERWENFAPLVVDDATNPRIQYRDLFAVDNSALPSNAPKIKPGFSSILRDYAIAFSMAGLSNPLDHKLDFAKRAQINVVGTASAFSLAMHKNRVVFTDPNTGVTYRAIARDNEDLSPGYRLLKDAANFVSDGSGEAPKGPWYEAKLALKDAQTEEEKRQAQQKFKRQSNILNEKIRVIEQISRLSKKFGE